MRIHLAKFFEPIALKQVLPPHGRDMLFDMLRKSHTNDVHKLLALRNLNGLQRLYPADHPAGAPYEAGLLLIAALLEGKHFSPNMSQTIASLAVQVEGRNAESIARFEALISATLSMMRQLDFGSISQLAIKSGSLEDWLFMGELFLEQANHAEAMYTALVYIQKPRELAAYYGQQKESFIADVNDSLKYGAGAVRCLVESERPIFQNRLVPDALWNLVGDYRPAVFSKWSLYANEWMLLLKLCLAFTASWLLFSCLMRLYALIMNPRVRCQLSFARRCLSQFCKIVICTIVVLLSCIFLEPDILQTGGFTTHHHVDVNLATSTDPMPTETFTDMEDFNQITLFVLALFFILQLVIYSFCLIKIREISVRDLSASMKLKLLDNEENLFDFGLYVGLGGTVLSLILLAMGIFETSLMAAYASTLFGILFAAILKVVHIRPLRGRLLFEAEELA